MTLFKGYRTWLINILMGLPLAWDVIWQVLQTREFHAVIPAEYLPYYSLAMVLVNMFMRKITTTPAGVRT